MALAFVGALVYFAVAREGKDSVAAPPSAPLLASSNVIPHGPAPFPATNVEVTARSTNAVDVSTNDPNALVERMNRANDFLAQGQFTNALPLLREAARIAPDDEDVHYNLGIALSRLGKTDEAVHEYEEAIRLLPDYAEAHNNLGNLLLRSGRRDDAIKQFQEAVRVTPDYAVAWNNLGTALEQAGRTNEAGVDFRKASELDTNYWQARFNFGTTLLHERKFDEARAEFEAVRHLEPTFKPAAVALQRLSREEPGTPAPVQP